MSSPKFAAIIRALIQNTTDGKVEWAAVAGTQEYLAILPSHVIAIGVEGPDYVLRILDRDGDEIEQVKDPQLGSYMESPYTVMMQLHTLARRSSIGAEQALDAVLKELEGQ